MPGHIIIQAMRSSLHFKGNAYITVVGLLPTKKEVINAFFAEILISILLSHVNCNLYKSMNHPIIEFASSVWGPYTLLNVESIQSSAALIIILGQAASHLC